MSSNRRLLFVPFALVAALGLASPALTAPRVFEETPDSLGLLVVDVHMRYRSIPFVTTLGVQRGAIFEVSTNDTIAMLRHVVPTSDVSGYLVFPARTGRYRMLSAMGEAQMGKGKVYASVELGADSLANLAADVRAGEVSFLGTVEVFAVPHVLSKDEFRVRLEANPKRKAKALDKLAGRAKKTPWEERLSRMAAEAAKAAAGAPDEEESPAPDSTR